MLLILFDGLSGRNNATDHYSLEVCILKPPISVLVVSLSSIHLKVLKC